MAIEVLLMDQVEGLGIEGDIVKVADGYARNYLFPKGYASEVTEGRRRQIEKKRLARLAELEALKSVAEELAEKIANFTCTIEAKVVEEGKLFGSVGIPQFVEKLAEAGIEVERSKCKLTSPFHEIGEYEVRIQLHPDVEATLQVGIVEEK